MSAERQLGHTPHSQAQRSRSRGVNFDFFTERCRTPSWCRSAKFSNWRAARVLKTDDRATTSVVSIPSVRARRLWSLRKPHLLRSFEIYARHNPGAFQNPLGTSMISFVKRGDGVPLAPRFGRSCFHSITVK